MASMPTFEEAAAITAALHGWEVQTAAYGPLGHYVVVATPDQARVVTVQAPGPVEAVTRLDAALKASW